MSLVSLRKCPVFGCKFNTNPVPANYSQIKGHLIYDHDYKEKQETAFLLGLIDSINEKHSSTWFVNSLISFSKIGDVY